MLVGVAETVITINRGILFSRGNFSLLVTTKCSYFITSLGNVDQMEGVPKGTLEKRDLYFTLHFFFF
ncbi:hypothetical protein Y1Q_0000734 [Alligator mississippiensis]|uniref:Uncharacterized protein n=1 Tax=Alligator mississippiensis TaxID=8496 RepID=A0A151MCA6_ALLMI|nr:hypothetical protein Y1Q_0000734 [Alligator mississippiensis]